MTISPPITSTQDVLHSLSWRYATKAFIPDRRIPPDEWATLEKSLVLSPSSYGLQPWRFLVITDPAVRRELLPASHGQRKVVDSSHLVVFAARTEITHADVRRWAERLQAVQGLTDEQMERFYTVICKDLVDGPRSAESAAWAKRQVYIALGFFLTSAAMLGIDTCPMEGFDPVAYDRILGLSSEGYTATVLATAGYRSPNDTTATATKARFGGNDVIKHI